MKKIVWRCISRLDYGTKYCMKSPTLEEGAVQDAIVNALMDLASRDTAAFEMLKLHIGMGLRGEGGGEDEYALCQRMLDLESEASALFELEFQDENQRNYEAKIIALYSEKAALKAKLEQIQADERHARNEQARLSEIFAGMDKLRHQPIGFEDVVVRQMVECIRVLSKDRLRISFRVGGEMETEM